MGWLYMPRSSMGGHASARAYLDAQFTYERPQENGSSHGLKVLERLGDFAGSHR